MALPIYVTNPNLVNVADIAYDGLPVQSPVFISTPATTSPNNADGDDASPTRAPSSDQPVVVSGAMTAQRNIDGGTFSPQSVNTANTTQNNVAGQQYGTGVPRNVFV